MSRSSGHRTGTIRVAVLTIHGNLMGPPDTDDLIEKVKDLVENGVFRIVLELRHVRWINSLGVGSILHCRSMIDNAGGWLHLSSLSEKVRSVFIMSQLTKVFSIHDSFKEAVEELNKV